MELTGIADDSHYVADVLQNSGEFIALRNDLRLVLGQECLTAKAKEAIEAREDVRDAIYCNSSANLPALITGIMKQVGDDVRTATSSLAWKSMTDPSSEIAQKLQEAISRALQETFETIYDSQQPEDIDSLKIAQDPVPRNPINAPTQPNNSC